MHLIARHALQYLATYCRSQTTVSCSLLQENLVSYSILPGAACSFLTLNEKQSTGSCTLLQCTVYIVVKCSVLRIS